MAKKRKILVLKLGGSIISVKQQNVEEIEINFDYLVKLLKLFNQWLNNFVFDYIVVMPGGGYLNEKYLQVLSKKVEKLRKKNIVSDKVKDLIGISAIQINASALLFIATAMLGQKVVYEDIVDYDELQKIFEKKVHARVFFMRAKGVGHSSDFDAFRVANNFKNGVVLSMKNVDGIYEKDPKKFKNAKLFSRLTWKEYMKIFPSLKYEPRSHFPIDVTTSKVALNSDVSFVILDGRNLKNLSNYVKGRKFIGTVVSNLNKI